MESASCSRRSVGIALAAIAGILVLSCSSGSGSPGDGSGSFPIVDQPLQGTILGEAFTFVDGGAANSGTGGGGDYSFILVNKSHNPSISPYPWVVSAYSPLDYLCVQFDIPLAVGTYALGPHSTATLGSHTHGDSYLWADEGSIRIDSIDAVNHAVSGAIAARGSHNRDVWVNGDFTVQYEP